MNAASRKVKQATYRVLAACSSALGLKMLVPNCALAEREPGRPTITVQVYNYAEVSSGTLRRAEEEATRILAAAGIRTEWVDCSRFQGSSPIQSGPVNEVTEQCNRILDGTDILLRILPGSSPASHAFGETMFGFAEGGDVATVFYKRVANLTSGWDGDEHETPILLGDVVAHEIGHLLLGTNSHSPTGIMSAKWDREYLRLARMGFQRFSPGQSSSMRATLLLRNRQLAELGPRDTAPETTALGQAGGCR